ncbi:hypothetical protein QUA70_23175 [Microcoleus sp. LAD1_D5]|uniref:hypothetical protein n=1 Tax=unclassified Microcoleus TaxID=2642155 RepID=UPI002FD6BB5C
MTLTRCDRTLVSVSLWVRSDILHHCQERALRPVPQRMIFLVEQAEKPVPKQVIENGKISQLDATLSLVGALSISENSQNRSILKLF